MPTYLDEAAITGVASKAGEAAPAAPAGKLLSEEQITGTAPFEAEAAQGPSILSAVADMGVRLGKGTAAAADLVLGAPGQLGAVIANIGGRLGAMAAGASRKEQGISGEQAEAIVPESLRQPIQYLMKKFGGGEEYDQSVITKTVDSMAATLEKRTGGLITAEDAKAYFNTAMAAGGVKLGAAGMKAVQERLVKAAEPPPKATAPAEPPPEATTPGVKPLPEAIEITTSKQVKAIFKAAKEKAATGELTVKDLFDQALKRGAKPVEGEAAPEAPVVAKTHGGDIPLIGVEPPPPETPTLLDHNGSPVSAALAQGTYKMETGKAFDMTAEEKLAVAAAAKNSEALQAKPINLQRGSIDPKWIIGTFVATASGTALGIWAYRKFKEMVAEEVQKQLQQQQPKKEDTPQPLPPTIIPKDKRWITADMQDSAMTAAAIGALSLKAKWAAPAVEALSRVGKGLDYTLGNVSTRLGNVSPALKLRARDFERNVLQKTDVALDEVHPFLKEARALKGLEADRLNLALLQNDPHAIAAALEGKPELVRGYYQVRGLLDRFEETHKALGRFKEGITEYFPRVVKDLPGLKTALGGEAQAHIETLLARAEAKMVKEQQRGLTDIEQSLIVNRFLNSADAGSYLPGYAKGRHVKDLTTKLAPFYEKPVDSLLRYVSAAVQDIETARFFGKNLSDRKLGGKVLTDVDASIGNIVADELAAGRLAPEGANELRSILKSRFSGGEKATAGLLQDVRNVTNIGLLGSFNAAATQIGDSIMTVYHHGLMPTLSSLKGQLTGKPLITTKEFGLVNHIAEELGSTRMTGRALQYVFKLNGFQAIDQFAKRLNVNAGLIKNQRLARTKAGQLELADKYQLAFGDEFPTLLQDLQQGIKSENVKSLIFSELSDAQPITKMEMPQAYLDHPNGRLLYQMKTYMLKQMDVIRRDAYQEIKKGNYVRGAKNLVALAAALSLSNLPGDLVKDFLSGRELDLSKIDHVENLLQNFGLNRYTLDKLQGTTPAKGATEFAMGTVKPPILGMAADLDKPERLLKYVPSVGRLVYDRYYGGNEARKAVAEKRAKLEKRNAEEALYPWKKEARLKRQAAAAEKKRKRLEKIP